MMFMPSCGMLLNRMDFLADKIRPMMEKSQVKICNKYCFAQ